MASKLHNHAVITGYLDSFCLACGCFLRTEKEAFIHISESQHRKNLDLIPYLDKFKGDYIRKVQMGYYCGFCNTLFATASKVNLHIKEGSHNHNKGSLLLKLEGSDVLAFEDVLIQARSWHGITDNMCAVCNVEFEEENQHKINNKHLLNLVQKPVQFGANNAIFRHVDDDAIQCLTCETIIASNTMTKHFNDSKHLSMYDKCRNAKREKIKEGAAINGESTPKGINDTNVPAKKLDVKIKKETAVDSKSKILESITKYQKNMIHINLETDTASCKKCLVNIQFDYNTLEEHIANHSSLNGNVDTELLYPSHFDSNLNKVDVNERPVQKAANEKAVLDKLPHGNVGDVTTDSESINKTSNQSVNEDCFGNTAVSDKNAKSSTDKTTVDIKNYAEINHITYNEDQNKAYCRICKKRLSKTLNNMKEHVAGAMHKKNADIASKPKHLVKITLKKFLESKYDVSSQLFKDGVVINEKFYVNMISYMTITQTGSMSRCQVCEVTLCPDDEDGMTHVQFESHKQAMDSTPVVLSIRSEFIREIRAGVFHCGFCNLVVGSWAEVEMHLSCSEHDDQKNFSIWRLTMLRPEIAQYKRSEAMRFMLMMRNPLYHYL